MQELKATVSVTICVLEQEVMNPSLYSSCRGRGFEAELQSVLVIIFSHMSRCKCHPVSARVMQTEHEMDVSASYFDPD